GMFEMGGTFLNNLFSTTAGTIFRIGILPVYIFLFLYYRTKLAEFLLKLVPPHKKLIAVGVLRDMSVVVARFMGGMSTVVLVMVFLNFFGLWIAGARFPLMFGVIAALFNYIPYFGTIIGYSLPFVFTLLTGDAPIESVRILIVFFIAQFTENNILTPNIVGSALNLNPMIIILGVIGGGMIWGLPGMFAVIPFLAMIRIMGEHVEVFKPFSYLLGTRGTRKHAITAENIRNGWIRLKNRYGKDRRKV
ncbi:MAG: AI-2E family transporter, partial [Bacteroidota bacterium]